MHFTTASASLHCIKHHLKKAASQSTRSTHHRDRLSHEELAASGWRQALQLGEAMIVPPVVVSNSAHPSIATTVSNAISKRQLRHQPRLGTPDTPDRHAKKQKTLVPMPSYSNNATVKQNASIKHVPVTMQDKPGHNPAEKACTDKAQKTQYTKRQGQKQC